MNKTIEQMTFDEGKLSIKTGEILKSGYEWVICKLGSSEGMKFYKCSGTEDDAKEKLVQLIIEDRDDNQNEWEKGTDDISKISTLNCNEKILVGKGEYHFYIISYFAGRVDTLNEL